MRRKSLLGIKQFLHIVICIDIYLHNNFIPQAKNGARIVN